MGEDPLLEPVARHSKASAPISSRELHNNSTTFVLHGHHFIYAVYNITTQQDMIRLYNGIPQGLTGIEKPSGHYSVSHNYSSIIKTLCGPKFVGIEGGYCIASPTQARQEGETRTSQKPSKLPPSPSMCSHISTRLWVIGRLVLTPLNLP